MGVTGNNGRLIIEWSVKIIGTGEGVKDGMGEEDMRQYLKKSS